MKLFFSLALCCAVHAAAYSQNVGVGTPTPHASGLLHVFSGTNYSKGLLVSGSTHFTAAFPDLGPGSRLMFYPGKAAFRAGRVNDVQWDNSSVGLHSAAIGENTIASGASSFAAGSNTFASAGSATALGSETGASGFYSTALNYQTRATAYTSTAIGNNTLASGDNSLATGSYTIASGTSAFAAGDVTTAQGLASIAGGANTIALGDYSVALGNSTQATGEASFAAGSGTVAAAYASVALGRYNLTAGNATSWITTDPMIVVGNGTDGSNLSNIMEFYKNGNLGIAGNYYTLSDRTMKRNIQPLKNALQKISAISAYHYYWNSQLADQHLQTGIIAQEVQAQMPELVSTTLKGNLMVNYSGLTPYLIEAVKELGVRNEELMKYNEQLRSDVDLLKKQVAELMKTRN